MLFLAVDCQMTAQQLRTRVNISRLAQFLWVLSSGWAPFGGCSSESLRRLQSSHWVELQSPWLGAKGSVPRWLSHMAFTRSILAGCYQEASVPLCHVDLPVGWFESPFHVVTAFPTGSVQVQGVRSEGCGLYSQITLPFIQYLMV